MKGDRKKSLVSYEKTVGKKFRKKYEYDNNIFCRQITTQIIYNQKSRIVSAFKDNLIINDPTEFLKRYYTKRESKVRLKKYFDYYEEFSKIYPNYTAIHEGKYFYFNIQRKQRLIDIQEELEYKSRINRKEQRMNKFKFFNTDVYDSIVNDPDKEEIEFLFDIEVDMTKSEREKEENEFSQKVNDIITLIGDDTTNNEENTIYSNHNILLKIAPVNSNINQKKSNPSTDRTARDKFEIKYLRLLKLNQNLNNSIHNNSSSIHKNSTFIDSNNNKSKNKKSSSVTNKQSTLVPKTRNQGALTHRTKVSNTSVDMSKPPSTERIKQKYNNIIYIINNNPKYTTQVNFYNSNYVEKNKQIVKNKNAVLNRRVNSSIGRSASRSTSNSQSKKNDFLLKTARDIGYKEIHMIKDNSTSKPKHKKTMSNVNNVFLSRNNKKGLIFGEGAKTNTIRGFVDMVNSNSVNKNKNVIKGIHIKNFNKALSQTKK